MVTKTRPRPIEMIEADIEVMQQRHLKELEPLILEKRAAYRQQRLALTPKMIEILDYVATTNGATRKDIEKAVMFHRPQNYTNTMTGLVRRSAIVNLGTKRNPIWCIPTELNFIAPGS